MSNVTYRIEVKPVYQSLESLNAKVVYCLLCVVFWMLKSISVNVRQLAARTISPGLLAPELKTASPKLNTV